jgi:hypothetical protein
VPVSKTKPPTKDKMKAIKVELTEDEILNGNAIKRELDSVAAQLESDTEAIIVSEFIERVATARNLTPWRIACLASACASWSYIRGYSNGLDKGCEIGNSRRAVV